MLSLTRWHSTLQAAARVLSGGPVYVSDSPQDLRTHAQTVALEPSVEASCNPSLSPVFSSAATDYPFSREPPKR
ncbi:hypothetical protein cyc_08575 [Cyclospora cayetanensis]|uniref:Uncharacterized protein n=1 Tax=Cyclospora cayetanensis TaxID=88456 RepID=A0A1D3CZ79_9EIME|nr:hypothetical protein cyc_08575 [Cyclospora cayetanensis]